MQTLTTISSTTIALFFQNEASQGAITDPNQSLNFWLVIAGIVIIFVCLVLMLIPKIKDLLTLPQELNLSRLGISMRISILTVLVLVGVLLSLSSFALQWQGYIKQAEESSQKVAGLTATIQQLETRLNSEQKIDMSILVKPLETNEILKASEWTCTYWLDESGKVSDPIPASVIRARDGRHLRVSLKGIKLATRVFQIQLKRGNQVWNAEGFSPMTEAIWEAAPIPGGES